MSICRVWLSRGLVLFCLDTSSHSCFNPFPHTYQTLPDWCLNPNSGDTNGLLLDDWTTPDADKLDLLARVQPHPSIVSLQGDQICVVAGEYANPACVVR